MGHGPKRPVDPGDRSTEKYSAPLRRPNGWAGRRRVRILDQVVAALGAGDVRRIGAVTQRNFDGPIQAIIPWASNFFTEKPMAVRG